MRIVGGNLKGRPLAAPRGRGTRPTSDRTRETIFNILAHRFGLPKDTTRVLDLFAGSGALGLEALSRGAAAAVFVETAVPARGNIRENIESLGVTGRARIFRRDATRLGSAGTILPFDLVLCDPPYGEGLGEAALSAALSGGWMTPGAICVLEEVATATLELPEGLEIRDLRQTGDTQLIFLSTAGC